MPMPALITRNLPESKNSSSSAAVAIMAMALEASSSQGRAGPISHQPSATGSTTSRA